MGLTGLMWWIDRWRKSTAYMDMTLEEQGAYRNLLDEACLRGGPLPNDERILAKACGDATVWKRVRAAVMAHFTLGDDGYRHETLDEVIGQSQRRIEKQQRYRDKKQGHSPGHDGGNKRGNAHGNGVGNEHGNDGGNDTVGTLVTKPVTNPVTQILDLDRERSREQERSRHARGRVFTGMRLKVSQAQHQVLLDELGAASDGLDLLACYADWDAELTATPGQDFDTLPYIKQRAQERVATLRRMGSYREPDPEAEAAKLAREADNTRRAAEASALLTDIWGLVGGVTQRALRDEARAGLQAQGFWTRMTPEARDTAVEAAAFELLGERFRGRQALVAERDRLRMAKAGTGGTHAVAAIAGR